MGAPSKAQWSDLRDGAKAWDALPASDHWDTVFGTDHFLEAIAAHSNVGVRQISIFDEKGVCASARIATRSYLGITVAPVPPLTPYTAIRLRDDIREADVHQRSTPLEELLGAVEKRFPAASVHLPPSVQDTRVFSWRGWKVRPLYTYRIQLNATENPLAGWSESARRIARQEASDFEFVETDAETQARLVVASYARNGRKAPLGVQQMTSVVQSLLDDGTATTAGARSTESGEIDASITILRRGGEAYYWLAGGRRGSAMTVLLSHVLADLAAKGVQVFDFVGANTASIAEFKRKFGGQLTTYFRARWQRGLPGWILERRV